MKTLNIIFEEAMAELTTTCAGLSENEKTQVLLAYARAITICRPEAKREVESWFNSMLDYLFQPTTPQQ